MAEGGGPPGWQGGLFALPPGVDFPAALVAGLRQRLAGAPSEAMAEVEVYLNTARMRRAVTEAFSAAGPGFLPRLRLVTEFDRDPRFAAWPAAVPPLRRRLELARLVSGLIDRQPDLAPRSAVFDLADSLAALMAEMQDEGVSPAMIAGLDVADHSAHFQRTQAFLAIVAPLVAGDAAPDAERLRRDIVQALADRWRTDPPSHPVIVAGSTGSRGTTALLMRAVARLPRGAVVLPGFDRDLPAPVWAAMGDAMTGEDHPQFRHLRLAASLGPTPAEIRPWTDAAPARPALNRLVSLALRPAPVTDQWLTEGQDLPDLVAASAHVTLIEAADPRAEAQAIALILRAAVEDGQQVALVTPDRRLSRQVEAALDRWGIRPDDSAGEPLGLTAPGRFLRQVAALAGRRLTAGALLAVLKHPICASGADRGPHLRHARELELHMRRHGTAFPAPDDLRRWGGDADGRAAWAGWLAGMIERLDGPGPETLAGHAARHRALAEALAAGPGATGAGSLWHGAAGEAARAAMDDIATAADAAGPMDARDHAALLDGVLARQELRETVQAHPLVRFLGPREAREIRAARVVLGGLSEGIWPAAPDPDPWLNRALRQAAGLTLPERQIGLSAHDFQQAVAAPEVVLSRALRDAEADCLPARWLTRLTSLMDGLPARSGPAALAAMRDRGRRWLALAAAVDAPAARVPPAARPSPRPPVAARPAELAVTRIGRLVRDPYEVYARDILRLYPLRPLQPQADARLRGTVLHEILRRFITGHAGAPPDRAAGLLLGVADGVLADQVPWPAARLLWRVRLERAAPAFLAREAVEAGTPVLIEDAGGLPLPGLDFRLTARPDRIDRLADGRLHVIDYKTGALPTRPQQDQGLEIQLLLEAALAERGGFARLGPAAVARITYVGLDAVGSTLATDIDPVVTGKVWDGLCRLIGHYHRRGQGYTARRAVEHENDVGDYDHLSRFGEWDMTDPALPEDVG